MRELMNNNGKLMALMSGLFAGIMVVMGVVAILMGDLELSSLLADGSSAPAAPGRIPAPGSPAGRRSPRRTPAAARAGSCPSPPRRSRRWSTSTTSPTR